MPKSQKEKRKRKAVAAALATATAATAAAGTAATQTSGSGGQELSIFQQTLNFTVKDILDGFAEQQENRYGFCSTIIIKYLIADNVVEMIASFEDALQQLMTIPGVVSIKQFTDELRADFVTCPLSGKVFKNPVIALTGITYEAQDFQRMFPEEKTLVPHVTAKSLVNQVEMLERKYQSQFELVREVETFDFKFADVREVYLGMRSTHFKTLQALDEAKKDICFYDYKTHVVFRCMNYATGKIELFAINKMNLRIAQIFGNDSICFYAQPLSKMLMLSQKTFLAVQSRRGEVFRYCEPAKRPGFEQYGALPVFMLGADEMAICLLHPKRNYFLIKNKKELLAAFNHNTGDFVFSCQVHGEKVKIISKGTSYFSKFINQDVSSSAPSILAVESTAPSELNDTFVVNIPQSRGVYRVELYDCMPQPEESELKMTPINFTTAQVLANLRAHCDAQSVSEFSQVFDEIKSTFACPISLDSGSVVFVGDGVTYDPAAPGLNELKLSPITRKPIESPVRITDQLALRLATRVTEWENKRAAALADKKDDNKLKEMCREFVTQMWAVTEYLKNKSNVDELLATNIKKSERESKEFREIENDNMRQLVVRDAVKLVNYYFYFNREAFTRVLIGNKHQLMTFAGGRVNFSLTEEMYAYVNKYPELALMLNGVHLDDFGIVCTHEDQIAIRMKNTDGNMVVFVVGKTDVHNFLIKSSIPQQVDPLLLKFFNMLKDEKARSVLLAHIEKKHHSLVIDIKKVVHNGQFGSQINSMLYQATPVYLVEKFYLANDASSQLTPSVVDSKETLFAAVAANKQPAATELYNLTATVTAGSGGAADAVKKAPSMTAASCKK